jgi:glycine betaine/proline transport system substrate-binding protein
MRRLFLLLAFLPVLAGPAEAQSSVQTLAPSTQPATEIGTDAGSVETLPAPPPPCGTKPIGIARMPWPSAALLAEIHSRILTASFRCTVAVQEGDLAVAGSAMSSTGQPAVAPELWPTRIANIWNAALDGQQVRQAGATYSESPLEGWFLPDYALAQWPDLATIAGLAAHAAELAAPGQKPRFISCPLDWGCALINRNLLKAFGLADRFEIVEPANRFEMDTLIAEAVGRKQPILFYYWQPNAILAQFAFKPVALPAFDPDAFKCAGQGVCATLKPTGFAPDPVVIGLAEWVYLEAPQVAAYFGRARMPVAEMDKLLEELGEPGATVETVADRFVAEREAVWRPWVGQSLEPLAGR